MRIDCLNKMIWNLNRKGNVCHLFHLTISYDIIEILQASILIKDHRTLARKNNDSLVVRKTVWCLTNQSQVSPDEEHRLVDNIKHILKEVHPSQLDHSPKKKKLMEMLHNTRDRISWDYLIVCLHWFTEAMMNNKPD